MKDLSSSETTSNPTNPAPETTNARRKFLQTAAATTGGIILGLQSATSASAQNTPPNSTASSQPGTIKQPAPNRPAVQAPSAVKLVQAAPTNEKQCRHVLASEPQHSNVPDIISPEQWPTKREAIRTALWELMGTPSHTVVAPPQWKILSEQQHGECHHLKISYEVEPGEEVRAHLLIPPLEKRLVNSEGKAAAILTQHGTAAEAKETQLGAGKQGRDYGQRLAAQGFITLSPDSISAGERLPTGVRPYDTAPFYERHPNWSAVGKAVWDGSRALDILETLPEVDNTRLGSVGHSLGGYSTMFLAAFDERVKAGVSSCGLTTWQENPDRYHWSREEWYVHLPRLRPILQEQEKTGGLLPVEMHEFAALIAPRAFLNISGMSDHMYDNNETLPEAGLQLSALWQILGAHEKFANFLMGDGHHVPGYSHAVTAAWFQHWLKAPSASA